jgi:hypothetical protein
MGFIWDVAHLHWEQQFAELQQFHARHGHCRVPSQLAKTQRLYLWTSWQRKRLQKGFLEAGQKKRLDAIEFPWRNSNHMRWDQRIAELKRFKARHGHCQVPNRYSRNLILGRWVTKQRMYCQQDQLPTGRKAQLDALGFVWRPVPGKHIRAA